MGGYASGRWGKHQKALTVERCAVLSTADLLRMGAFAHVPPSGELIADVTYGDGRQERLWLQLQKTYPHFGGVRWWLTCGLGDPPCNRRVAKLYAPRGWGYGFACRQCYKLTYRSCQQSHVATWEDRTLKLLRSLEKRAGSHPNTLSGSNRRCPRS